MHSRPPNSRILHDCELAVDFPGPSNIVADDPIYKDPFMVPDSFGRKTEDSLSNYDSLIGDSSEEIESFEDTAAARHLGNILEDIVEVADIEVGTNKKSDEAATHSDAIHMPFQATTEGKKGEKNTKRALTKLWGTLE